MTPSSTSPASSPECNSEATAGRESDPAMGRLIGFIDHCVDGILVSRENVPRTEERVLTLEDVRKRLDIPPLYGGARLEDFPEHVRKLAATSLKDTLIFGPNGAGKTHLAAAIAFYFGARWCSMWNLLLRVRRTFHAGTAETELEILTKLSHPQVLVIDDLLAAQKTDFGMSTLLGLLNSRIEQKRVTIVTCDKSLADIDKIDSSLASRIAGFDRIQLAGPDRRIA